MNQSGNGVLVIAEHICKSHVSMADAFTAVETTFAAMDSGVAVNFPVVRQVLGHADALYRFKSGFDMRRMTLGGQIGWLLAAQYSRMEHRQPSIHHPAV
jgi:alanine dehydrogenase